MNVDLSLAEIAAEFDKAFSVMESIAMMNNTTGVRPRYITMHHSVVEKYFNGHIPINIFGMKVNIDPFCPEDIIYYSDYPFDASLEK